MATDGHTSTTKANPPNSFGSSAQSFRASILSPQIFLIAVNMVFVLSSSMIVNDYYDSKTNNTPSFHPLNNSNNNSGLSFTTAKTFVSLVYAALLTTTCFLPTPQARLIVILSAIATFKVSERTSAKPSAAENRRNSILKTNPPYAPTVHPPAQANHLRQEHKRGDGRCGQHDGRGLDVVRPFEGG